MNMVHSGLKAFVPAEQDEMMTTYADCCPICAVPFKADDVCASDIDMGACHFACLEGSPVVSLETGEPYNGPVATYPWSDVAP